jgi:hypothetical protein
MLGIHPEQTAENLRAYNTLSKLEHNTREGMRKALYFIGRRVTRDARRYILDKNKTGRVYLVRINNRLKRHQASARYESPANLTGGLQRSLNFLVKGYDEVEIGANVFYAGKLEKIMDRPYLIKAINANDRYITEMFSKEITNALRGRH